MTPAAEIHGDTRILKGPPIPAILPAKGVGVFLETGKLRFFVLARFNESNTTVRTPISFKNAMRLFLYLWRSS